MHHDFGFQLGTLQNSFKFSSPRTSGFISKVYVSVLNLSFKRHVGSLMKLKFAQWIFAYISPLLARCKNVCPF